MPDTVRVGICRVGLGRSGWNLHADTLSRLPEHFRIAAAMDLSRLRRAEAEARFACATFATFAELTEADIDLIVVATPARLTLSTPLPRWGLVSTSW